MKTRRTAISLTVRRALARRYGCAPGLSVWQRCYWCENAGRVTWHMGGLITFEQQIDHLIPVSKGGTNDVWNLVLACGYCNASRGARAEDEFRLIANGRLREAMQAEIDTELLGWMQRWGTGWQPLHFVPREWRA
jgi:hypothetical protein